MPGGLLVVIRKRYIIPARFFSNKGVKNMAIIDLSETDLRQLIDKKKRQYNSAVWRYDVYGTFKAQGQMNKYLYDCADLLRIAKKNGYYVTDDEISIIKLTVGGV